MFLTELTKEITDQEKVRQTWFVKQLLYAIAIQGFKGPLLPKLALNDVFHRAETCLFKYKNRVTNHNLQAPLWVDLLKTTFNWYFPADCFFFNFSHWALWITPSNPIILLKYVAVVFFQVAWAPQTKCPRSVDHCIQTNNSRYLQTSANHYQKHYLDG